MRTLRNRLGHAGLALAMVVLLTGCGDKLTFANFSQIRQDVSTKPIVAGLIGDPDDELDNRWYYERPDKHLTVLVDFDESGYVSRKQWIDAMTATWEDSEPMDADEGSREGVRLRRGSE